MVDALKENSLPLEQDSLLGMIRRRTTKRYTIALSLVAIMASISYFVAHRIIVAQQSSASIINMSGRQRMLSQRVALLSLIAANEKNLQVRQENVKEIKDDLRQLKDTHEKLVYFPQRIAAGYGEMSVEMKDLYFGPIVSVHQRMQNFIRDGELLVHDIEISSQPIGGQHPMVRNLVTEGSGELILSLDKVVYQYQLENEHALAKLERIEVIVMVTTWCLLVFELIFIFRPMDTTIATILKVVMLTRKSKGHST